MFFSNFSIDEQGIITGKGKGKTGDFEFKGKV